MKRNLPFLALTVFILLTACTAEQSVFVIENPSGQQGQRVTTIKDVANNELLKQALDADFSVLQDGDEIQTQLFKDPVTGTVDLLLYPEIKGPTELVFVAAKTSQKTFKPKAHAELWHKTGGDFIDQEYVGGGDFVETNALRVPDECTDHSYFIKYEGPGWESNLVGYRFYLDWRNAVDVFGKTTEKMVLDQVGQDGYDSYHEMQNWGMDVLKVGASLGVGSIGYWNGEAAERVAETDSVYCEVLSPEGLRALIQTNYYGWQTNDFKTNVQSYISIDGNSRLSKETLVFDQSPANVCTGIHKIENGEKIVIEKGNYTCLATWGEQSLNNDLLGLFVIAKKSDIVAQNEDEINYVIVLKPQENKAEWLFGAAWEQEPNGIKTLEAFKAYLNEQLELLNNPDKVKL